MLLCLPTEATVERVFSVVKAYFGANRSSALADYIEASVILILNPELE